MDETAIPKWLVKGARFSRKNKPKKVYLAVRLDLETRAVLGLAEDPRSLRASKTGYRRRVLREDVWVHFSQVVPPNMDKPKPKKADVEEEYEDQWPDKSEPGDDARWEEI